MAAALQCEICGGKLIGKPGGIFECDSCGMEYNTEWARAKIQEIKGTVKVEGTVEVTGKVQVEGGTVQVEGAANAASLLRRGELALEDKRWDEAVQYYDRVLDIEPENADAYLGKLLAKYQCTSIERLKTAAKAFDHDTDFNRLLRFGNGALKAELMACAEANRAHLAQVKADAEAARKEMEAKRKAIREEAEAKKQAEEAARVEYLKSVLPTVGGKMGIYLASGALTSISLKSDGTVYANSGMDKARYLQTEASRWTDIIAVTSGTGFCAGLKADGTVVVAGDNTFEVKKAETWSKIVAISAGDYSIVGLKEDGTVVAAGSNTDGRCDVSDWKGIIAVSAGGGHTVGLKSDGTVIATTYKGGIQYYKKQCDVQQWRDITAIAAAGNHTIGLKKDGTVVAAGDNSYGACNVKDWTGIVAIASGNIETLGLKPDGTVVSTSANTTWKDKWKGIVAIGQGGECGLRLDGSIEGGVWEKLFDNFEEEWKRVREREEKWRKAIEERAEADRKAEEARAEAERKAAEQAEAERHAQRITLETERTGLKTELKNLKGLFTGKRQKEIEERLTQIGKELKKLER